MKIAALFLLVIAVVVPVRAQIRADEVNGIDAFQQINNTIAVLYGTMTAGMPNQGIVDATNLKGNRAIGIQTALMINQSQIQVKLGGAQYTPLGGMTPYLGMMVSIGGTASAPVAVNNVDLAGQGDKATQIICSTGTVPCIAIYAGSHIHIHDMTIIGNTTGGVQQDCIQIAWGATTTNQLQRIDSIEIDHIHFMGCGHSNIEAWGVTNLRIHDNTFDKSGYAGLAFPIPMASACYKTITNSAYTNPIAGNPIVQVTTNTPTLDYVVGDYVYVNGSGSLLNGAHKVVDNSVAFSTTYEFISSATGGSGGNTYLTTCDNGVWIENNVMNDYATVGGLSGPANPPTIGGISFTETSENETMSAVPTTQGTVTAFTNVHIDGNIIKCLSNTNGGQYDKVTIRANFMADSEISGNNLIACGGGSVNGENVSMIGYHVIVDNNDLWNSEPGSACLLSTQNSIANMGNSLLSCPNSTCGGEGITVHGNRFHNCSTATVEWSIAEDSGAGTVQASNITDNDISGNEADDSGTGLTAYGFLLLDPATINSCTLHTSPIYCQFNISRFHIHNNIWGDLAVPTSGTGNEAYMSLTATPAVYGGMSGIVRNAGVIDFWGDNSGTPASSSIPFESGFLRRNLKDIYCISWATADISCNGSYPANSDYGGSAYLSSGTFTRTFTGIYSQAPACTASDMIHPIALQVATSIATPPGTMTITGSGTFPGDQVSYTCEVIVAHN